MRNVMSPPLNPEFGVQLNVDVVVFVIVKGNIDMGYQAVYAQVLIVDHAMGYRPAQC
jgi:hypothetical protein